MTDKQVTLWECPDCCFAFDARHVNSTGEGHSCPNCAEAALTARVADLERRVKAMQDALAEATKEKRESAQAALSDACHIVWHHKSVEHYGCQHHPHFWSIPADKNRDVDLRIGDMLAVLDKACDALAQLDVADEVEAI